jgi:hypothetical protein
MPDGTAEIYFATGLVGSVRCPNTASAFFCCSSVSDQIPANARQDQPRNPEQSGCDGGWRIAMVEIRRFGAVQIVDHALAAIVEVPAE